MSILAKAIEKLDEAIEDFDTKVGGIVNDDLSLQPLDVIEQMEVDVAVAFAEETKDINPSLMGDIKRRDANGVGPHISTLKFIREFQKQRQNQVLPVAGHS
jgi:hypothetical protein